MVRDSRRRELAGANGASGVLRQSVELVLERVAAVRYLSLFSGIEAASVAWERLGWECAAVAEIEPFPCKVLAYHYPDVPNLGDITQITQERIEALGHIDLVVFGAPCQDLSVAGKRKGMLNDDGSPTRSGLFYAAERIATWAGARWAIYENVPGMFSSNAGADFASVVGEMAGAEFDVPKNKWRNAGVAVGPRGLVEWVTLDAQYVRTPEFARAVPQRRRRVFVVRDSGDWSSRPPLFLEPESMCGNPPPSRTPGKTVAHDVAGSLVGSGCTVGGEVSHTLSSEGFDASEDGTGRGTPIVARCLTTGEGARLDGESCNFIAIQGSMIGRADHAGPAGSGVDETGACFTLLKTDVHAVAFGIRTANTSSNGCGVSDGLAYTLDQAQGQAVAYLRGEERGGMDGRAQESSDGLSGGVLRNLQSGKIGSSSQGFGLDESRTGESAASLSQLPHEGSQGCGEMRFVRQAAQGVGVLRHALPEVQEVGRPDHDKGQSVCCGSEGFGDESKKSMQGSGLQRGSSRERVLREACSTGEPRNIGDGTKDQARGSIGTMAVRRLLPIECERLQGFPDQWTNIPGASDSARYKALGNSMACNVMHFIGQRINDSH